MSGLRKIPRVIPVLLTIIVLAILIWRLALGTAFFGYWLGGAILVTLAVILAVYWRRAPKTTGTPGKSARATADGNGSAQNLAVADAASREPAGPASETEPAVPPLTVQSVQNKPDGAEVASRYRQMNPVKTGRDGVSPAAAQAIPPLPSGESALAAPAQPPIPLIEDETELADEEKNELVNAVWYRCENPYCKYTSFLSIHHIIEEKDGGTNRLDNLIVLCPYCHDLAHRGEIPVDRMREWIGTEERFKVKLTWHYR